MGGGLDEPMRGGLGERTRFGFVIGRPENLAMLKGPVTAKRICNGVEQMVLTDLLPGYVTAAVVSNCRVRERT